VRKIAALLLILVLQQFSWAQTSATSSERPLVFVHAHLIDMTGAAPQTDMTVVVVGNRIAKIGKSREVKIPKGAKVFDARGKFLIPGLWNMHVHFGDDDFDRNYTLQLYIAEGVTGIRIMDGEAVYYRWRNEQESGTLFAPRMVVASRVIGFGDLSNISAQRAREEVRRAKQEGANFIKVHDNLSRESYLALMDEARHLKLPVEGHVPNSMTAAEVAQAGQRSIEHFTGLDEAAFDERRAEELIPILKRNHTWLCPTIIMRSNYASLDNADFANDPRLKYVKPSWKERWLRMTKDASKTPAEEWTKRRETVRREKALVEKMERAGVALLAGTDDANPYVFPGFSLHDELAMLVEAGLTPLEALRAATVNPAKFFGREKELGTIEKGKLADLVLLDADPLADIHNTGKINAVVFDGRLLERSALDSILSRIEAAVNKR
jgi:imidazolonepropionase-like amidohydrolase